MNVDPLFVSVFIDVKFASVEQIIKSIFARNVSRYLKKTFCRFAWFIFSDYICGIILG